MACTTCNQTQNKCTCTTVSSCVSEDCSCPVRIGTDCWTYTGDDLECSGISKDTIGTEAIQQLDEFICTKFAEVQNFFTITNIGNGADVYKGIDLLGQKELRTISKLGDLITVTENTNEITISIDEDELTTFVEGLDTNTNSTYTIDNLSTGAEIYKNDTVVGDNTQFNFRTVIKTGDLITITQNTNDITVSIDEAELTSFVEALNVDTNNTYSVSNLSDGADIYKDSTVVGDNTQFNLRSIKSTSLSVTENTNDITIEVAPQAQVDVLETNISDPSFIQNKNPTKTVTLGVAGNYNVVDADNNYVVEIDNGANNVTITFTSVTATDNFFVGFVQKGTGTVTFSGYTILPLDLTAVLYGQGHIAAMEVINSTKYLHGTLIPL
jgi:hypothetical protein